MNIEDSLNVVVKRTKLVEDVNTLQANVINANKNLLKHQVSQDTNYWHLKEKYDQVKGARERLQQNMVQLQMQLEAVSGECQQERRLRAETLNKLNSTRNLCDELERLVQQSKDRYVQTKADQDALCDAYKKSDEVVQKLKQNYLSMKEKAEQRIRELEGKMTQMMTQQNQMSTLYTQCQKRTDADLCELQSQLREARVAERELAASNIKLGAVKAELEQREAIISNLQRDMRYMVNQLAEGKSIVMKKDNDLKNATEEIDSLKKALSNQEQFTKMQCDQNSALQEKLALLEEEHQKDIAAYKIKVEEVNSMCQTLNSNIAKLQEEKDNLTKELNDKQETLSLYDGELELLKEQLLQYDTKLEKITLDFSNTTEESQKKTKIIEKLETENETLVMKISDVESAFTNYREAVEEKLKEQATIIEETNKEQELKGSIIVKEREERVKLEKELQSQALTLKESSHELELKTEALNQTNNKLQFTMDECEKLAIELQNKTEIIEQMDRDLQLKCSTMLQNKEQYDKLVQELQTKAATLEEINMELEVNISALAKEKEERAKVEAALQQFKSDSETESEAAKEREKNLKEKVRQLEAGIRAKDEELSRELTNFLKRRNEFEKEKRALLDAKDGLEERINKIIKEASSSIHHETPRVLPEPSDNAMMLTRQEPGNFAFAARRNASPTAPPPAEKRSRPDSPLVRGKSYRANVATAPQEQRNFAFAARRNASPPAPLPAEKRSRPDTPLARGKSYRANVATADKKPPESKPKEYRFFKSRANAKK